MTKKLLKLALAAVPLTIMTLTFAPALAQQSQQYKYPFQNPDLPAAQRIANILSLMTIEEKIDFLSTDTSVKRLGIPSFGGSEGIHGVVQRAKSQGGYRPEAIPTTQFPQPPGMGETWDPSIVRAAAGVEGHEARFISQTEKYGERPILMLWGPQSDLARDPRWGRSEEVYGEDPFFNGTMVTAFVHGLQGDNPRYWQAASLLKHFLANSNEKDRTKTSSNFDDRLFWEYYSVPFRMGFLDGGAKAVMASYNAWNGTHMAVNPVLKSILVKQWGVDVLSSDGGGVSALVRDAHAYPDQQTAVEACLKAGINQFLDFYKPQAREALKDGAITPSDLDELVGRKLRITLKLGLVDPPSMNPYTSVKDAPDPWTTEADTSVSKKIALESVVLLKNENQTLPLNKQTLKSIAVIGPLADSVHWDWYGGIPPYTVTPLEGIKQIVAPQTAVLYAKDETNHAAVDAARKAEVAVVFVGNDPTCGPDMPHDWTGNGTLPCTVPSNGREGRDRDSIDLGQQEQLVKQVYAVNPHSIVVLISSFPFAINWTEANIPAILHMAHSSQDEGTALAQVLFGDYNPGGHLTTTWPKSLDQLPAMMDYNIRDGRTYMYFKGTPLYPFGFGLSYTTFKFSNLKPSTTHLAKDGSIQVAVDVTNTGTRTGDEVVQLYVTHLKSKVSRPREELEGFQRVTLQPNETKTVDIPLPAASLAYWNDKESKFVVESEPVKLMIGDSSADLKLNTTIQVP